MASKINLSPEQIQNIMSLYQNDGYSAQTISTIIGHSSGFVQQLLRLNGLKLRTLSKACNRVKNLNNIFETIDTEYSAYYLGLFFADGSIKKDNNNCCELKLIEQDRYILSKLSNLIFRKDRTIFINYKSYSYAGNANNLYTLKIVSPEIKNSLISYGCTPRKSLTLKFPQNIPDHLLNHFIRGYFDGDGCIQKDNDGKDFKFSIISTDDFCQSVKNIVDRFNIYCRISINHPSNNITKSLNINGNRQVLKFMTWLYKDATYYLERKHNKYLELVERCADIDRRYPNRFNKYH